MEKKWRTMRMLPAVLAISIVPLIATAKKYNIGLSQYSWFSNSTVSIDIFLYWKGQALILLAYLLLLFAVVSLAKKEYRPDKKRMCSAETISLAVYGLFVLISTGLSQYGEVAAKGGYEQWEGCNVIFAYLVLCLFVYWFVDKKSVIHLFVYGLIVGSTVLGLIGAGQFFGADFFRSDMGKNVMNLLMETKMNFSFNFPEGWVYATLYNPNYVGSYVALVFPVLFAVVTAKWKEFHPFFLVLSYVDLLLMVITLIGSQSLTGIVGVCVSVIFVVAYKFPETLERIGWKKMAGTVACAAAVLAVVCAVDSEQVQAGLNKLFHPTKDYHEIAQMLSTKKGLEITTVEGKVCYVSVADDLAVAPAVTDANGNPMTLKKDSERNYYTFEDEAFDNFRLYPETIEVKDTIYYGVKVFNPTINKTWNIAKVDGTYMVYTIHGKLDTLEKIPATGFKEHQHFGDKRGYIWSRTIPLLGQYVIAGSGPNTFTLVFPNNDYVGKTNMNYDGVAVTKPHNMYLQTWVQTGLISLLAFLTCFVVYFVKSCRLYWKRKLETTQEKIGFALMVALLGYMVTGIANDSTVTVAPAFWGLLGLAMAVNEMIGRDEKKKIKNY
ncbi:MAG: O-antigen ligase family protein [Eubacterium sp.]|nr:O-antigen ligase family protein [Eubacterium sp.]